MPRSLPLTAKGTGEIVLAHRAPTEKGTGEIVLAHRAPNVAASDMHSFFMCHKGEKECTQFQGNKHSDVYSHMLISVVYLFRSDVLSCALHL